MDNKTLFKNLYYSEYKKNKQLKDEVRGVLSSLPRDVDQYSEKDLKSTIKRIKEKLEKAIGY